MQANNPQLFTISVEAAHFGSESSSIAYNFVRELVNKHRVDSVFFIMDGVYNASKFVNPANDEFNLPEAWVELAKKNNFKLKVCVAAAERRGITEKSIALGFEFATLADFAELVKKSDKLVQFK